MKRRADARDPEVQNWGLPSRSIVRDPQGGFELHGLRPGSYYLVATSMDDGRLFNVFGRFRTTQRLRNAVEEPQG